MARTRKTAGTEETPLEMAQSDVETVVLSEPAPLVEAASVIESPPRTEAAPSPPPRRRGMSVLLGGALAACVGAGAAVFALPRLPESLRAAILPDATTPDPRIDEQAASISELRASIAALSAVPAENPDIPAALAGIEAMTARLVSLESEVSALTETLGTLEPRLTALEKRPVAGGGVSSTAVDALSREIEALKSQIISPDTGSVKAEIEAAAAAAAERIAAAEKSAADLAAAAEEAGRKAAARAALSHVEAALESGAPIDRALGDLAAAGVTVPAALADLAQGVPSLAMLRDSFVEAARDALVLSVRETAGDDIWSRMGAFLRSQTGARSLTPRAGTDPDAVLSRAEAAVAAGDLTAAIAELEALPEQGKARMAEWIALANRRLTAVAAVAEVSAAIGRGE